MKIRATYNKAGHVVQHYDFDLHGDEDFTHGAGAAYAHFHAIHGGASVFDNDVEIVFKKFE